jgi:hypothetical protein
MSAANEALQRAEKIWRTVVDRTGQAEVGAALAGSVILAAGAMTGATEAAVAALAAYAAFRMLRGRS